MTLRKLLLIPLFISVILLAVYSKEIIVTIHLVVSSIRLEPLFVFLIIFSLLFQLIGHFLRSKKATFLFSPIEKSKTSTQLRAFSVGQLFNNILPLRIGEFIRTAIISQKLSVSYSYTFLLVIFERCLDILFIVLGITLVFLITTITVPMLVWQTLIGLTLVGVLGLAIIAVSSYQPRWLLRVIYVISNLFNVKVKNLIRFKFWSLGYGLKKSLTKETLPRYLTFTVLMWLSYLVSTLLVALAIFQATNIGDYIIASFAPYIGIATPAGPAGLGVFSVSVDSILNTTILGKSTLFNIISWSMILIPISVIGLLSLPKTAEPIWKKRSKGASDVSLVNKVIRNEDVSGELEHFLEGYYRGNNLSKIVNRLEFEEDFSLVKYFRGGSDAITVLALRRSKRTVKKIIPIELKDRLKAQYDWLKKYGGGAIVKTSNEKTADDYYSIDIAFDKSSVPLFEYVHEIPLKRAQKLLKDSWASLDRRVYKSAGDTVSDKGALEAYIEKHIYGCIEKAGKVDPAILEATKPKKLVVNGLEYDNLRQVIAKIKKNPQAWDDLSTYRSTGVVHGDMIIDNILYSRDKRRPIVIDPAPDGNIFEGPVFDFGKAAQSLYCGYEFLLRDENRVHLVNGNEISFNEGKSLRFSELDDFMRNTLAKEYLTDGERKAILFHAGSLFIRRLKHQVHYTPENALKFYAVGVRTLNNFIDQY